MLGYVPHVMGAVFYAMVKLCLSYNLCNSVVSHAMVVYLVAMSHAMTMFAMQ